MDKNDKLKLETRKETIKRLSHVDGLRYYGLR